MAKISVEAIEDGKIRRHWDENSGQYYFSIVDIIALVTNSTDPRNYWKVLKSRLKNTQKELVTKCNQLKMRAVDSKFYLTDTADKETLLEIIKLVSKEDVEVFNRWFNRKERERAENKIPEKDSFPSSEGGQNQAYDESYPQPEAELLIDAYQTGDDIFIQTFVAGVIEKDLSIHITCNEVTIKGKRESKENISDNSYHEQELYWGEFSRTISLPEEIEIEKVEATNSHGFLLIKLPKINKSLEKKVEIKFI
jgi:HSP20 family molecular chaperone IbpA